MIKYNKKHSLWVEKYRPQNLNDIIFEDSKQQKMFEKIVKTKELPNLLLYGTKGTGKSTTVNVLLKELEVDDLDILEINCSDEKIDALRSKVTDFVNTMPLGKYKVVLLTEFDGMSLSGQELLKDLIELKSLTARFLATCNHHNKIIPELKSSRFISIKYEKPNKEQMIFRLADILDNEDITYDPKDLLTYVDICYPDIRLCIQTIYININENKVLLSPNKDKDILENDWKFSLFNCLESGDFKSARTLVCNNISSSDFSEVYSFLYKNINKFKEEYRDQIILTVAEYLYKNSFVADQEINLAACLITIKNILQK